MANKLEAMARAVKNAATAAMIGMDSTTEGRTVIQQIQHEAGDWRQKNFPMATDFEQLLGVCEETGELCHAHLKLRQHIRGTPDELLLKEKDAIGDIVIFLMNYCNLRGYDLEELVAETWVEVRNRDWTEK